MATQPKPRTGALEMPSAQPNPAQIFESINSFQKTFAIKAAIELEIFTAIGEGSKTAAAIAKRCNAAERGVRILCDYLTVHELLRKHDGKYETTVNTATFLDKNSPAYMGGMIEFLLSPHAFERFGDITNAVRNGGAVQGDGVDTTTPDNPLWERFARGMTGMIAPIAQAAAKTVELPTEKETKVLDIAASHGLFGFSIAQRYPKAHIVALDWKNVLKVTKENAQKFGFADRFATIEGDAFTVDFGKDYDLILVPNLLHHFSAKENENLLEKCRGALKSTGMVAIVEFVPNDDRVTPPMPAAFAINMLVGTPEGDAYTFAELRQMLNNSGYKGVEQHSLSPLPHDVIIGRQ